jgi:pyridoxal phosphate enzyme (YggS family)
MTNMSRADEIAARLREVRDRIAEAAVGAGRAPDSVRLIAVSKRMPAEDVAAARDAGQQDFGENYAQELRDKRLAVSPPVRWHYLGPIQRNKVKYLAGQVALIQSVDDADVVTEIDRRLDGEAQAGPAVEQPCLVQVNVAAETRKGGVPPHMLGALLDRFATSTHASCVGLMLIPPLEDDPAATRRHFAALRELAEREARVPRPRVALRELSMGMSADYADAIAEGATMVRVGTAIFGARG